MCSAPLRYALAALTYLQAYGYTVKPFQVDLSSEVPHLRTLLQHTRLPDTSVLNEGLSAGTPLQWLKDRQEQWLNESDWKMREAAINTFNHSTVDIEGMTVHFIHQQSSSKNATPILLTHGWPGSFFEFSEVIEPLTDPGKDSNVSFHVIVPSLPGFGFSSPAPKGWTNNNTATLFNTLLVNVLGYKSYAASAGDWGAAVNWGLQNNHAGHLRAVHYAGLVPVLTPRIEDLLANPEFRNDTLALNDTQKAKLTYNNVWLDNGQGYFLEQRTKPSTIGLALYDNPIGQLSWIGEKFLNWSDPQYGVPPSHITNETILTEVSIYYLTKTFETAGNIYHQNFNTLSPVIIPAESDIPMGYSSQQWDITYYPEFYLKKVGNLVFFREHNRGGHFGALDNPDSYVADLRDMMGTFFKP